MDDNALKKFVNPEVLARFVESCGDDGYLVKFRNYMAECGIELTIEEIKDSCEHAKQLLRP